MDSLYYAPERAGSLSGAATLSRYSGQSKVQVNNFLSAQPAYTIHKPVRYKFTRRKIFSKGIGDLYQCDLADMSSLAKHNDGKRYLLVCSDVFSKKAWAVALRTKLSEEVATAFEQHIITSDGAPNLLQSDKGSEFISHHFQSMLQRHGIRWYTTHNQETKASCAERFIRTLKQRLYRYFTWKNNYRYLDILQDVLRSYNDTRHKSIGMAPAQVNQENAHEVAARLYPPKPKIFVWKFRVGDYVRISVARTVFRKGFVGGWSEDIFCVSERHATDPVTYGISNFNLSESIKGAFYEPEMQLVQPPTDDYYVVEKIIKTRRRNGRVEHYVHWRGYPDSADSWTSDVRKL